MTSQQPFVVFQDENIPEQLNAHLPARRHQRGDVKDIAGHIRAPFSDVTNQRAQEIIAIDDEEPSLYADADDDNLDDMHHGGHDAKMQRLDDHSARGTQSGAVASQRQRRQAVPSTTQHTQLQAQAQAQARVEPVLATTAPAPMWVDIDAPHMQNPQFAGAYMPQIFSHLRSIEARDRPLLQYMDATQEDINASMRAILIDWLNEVAQEYNLHPNTLYLSVNLIDRFLSVTAVVRSKLQLVGVTCMLIAAKYEEISPPAVDDMVYITDNTYTRDEVLRMESQVLNTLRFNVTVATSHDFLDRLLRAANADPRTAMLARYLSEMTLQEYAFISYIPSMVATCAVVLALHSVNANSWSPTIEHYSGFQPHELRACLAEMFQVYRNAEFNNLQAVREKYSHTRYMRVALAPAPLSLPLRFL
jgi:cyclin A